MGNSVLIPAHYTTLLLKDIVCDKIMQNIPLINIIQHQRANANN